jgi:hypothetical protein
MHSIPYAIEKQLSKASSILGLRLFLRQANQLVFDLNRATSAFLQVIEHVAVGICQRQSGNRRRKVSPKACAPVTMAAFVSRKVEANVFDFASATSSIFFRKKTSLHLFH